MDKIYSLLDFISVASKATDAPLLSQSPDYLSEKFKFYIGEYENFEFPKMDRSYLCKEVDDYISRWGSLITDHEYNIVVFLSQANWDSRTFPTKKVEIFEKCIGKFSSIKEHEYNGVGLHPLLNEWLDNLVSRGDIQKDLFILNRKVTLNDLLESD